jgi:hypothetical protein
MAVLLNKSYYLVYQITLFLSVKYPLTFVRPPSLCALITEVHKHFSLIQGIGVGQLPIIRFRTPR